MFVKKEISVKLIGGDCTFFLKKVENLIYTLTTFDYKIKLKYFFQASFFVCGKGNA